MRKSSHVRSFSHYVHHIRIYYTIKALITCKMDIDASYFTQRQTHIAMMILGRSFLPVRTVFDLRSEAEMNCISYLRRRCCQVRMKACSSQSLMKRGPSTSVHVCVKQTVRNVQVKQTVTMV